MSEICKNWSTWLKTTRFGYMSEIQVQQTLNWLNMVKNQVLDLADLEPGQKIADFGCGSGLLAFGVLERMEDKVELIFSDKFQDCLEECQKILETTQINHNTKFLQSDIADIKLKNEYLDRALTRSVLVHVKEKQPAFDELYRVLKMDGIYCAFEPIISQNTKYFELLLPTEVTDYFDFQKAEREFMSNPNDPLVNFNASSLEENLKTSGFRDYCVDVNPTISKYTPTTQMVKDWFILPPAPDQKTMKERFLDYFEEPKIDRFIEEISQVLPTREIKIISKTALIKAIK